MTDEDIAATEVGQHRPAHLACPGPLRMLGHILGAPCDGTAFEHCTRLRKIGIGYAHGDLGTTADAVPHGMQQAKIGSETAVHFPVSSNKFGAHDDMGAFTRSPRL